MPDIRAQIAKRISMDDSVLVWVPPDFAPLGSRGAIDKALQRMAAAGEHIAPGWPAPAALGGVRRFVRSDRTLLAQAVQVAADRRGGQSQGLSKIASIDRAALEDLPADPVTGRLVHLSEFHYISVTLFRRRLKLEAVMGE